MILWLQLVPIFGIELYGILKWSRMIIPYITKNIYIKQNIPLKF